MDFNIKERLQVREAVIAFLIFIIPIIGIIVFGNMYPESMSAPLAIGIMAAGIVLSFVPVFSRNRNRTLTITDLRWTLKDQGSGKVIMEFDLNSPHKMMIAIRQGVIGKYAKSLERWLQVSLVQNGQMLKLESEYIEASALKGVIEAECCAQIKDLSNPLLKTAAARNYTYNEADFCKENGKVGSSVHGFSSYMEGSGPDLYKAVIDSADRSRFNTFLVNIQAFRNSLPKFSEVEKQFSAISQ